MGREIVARYPYRVYADPAEDEDDGYEVSFDCPGCGAHIGCGAGFDDDDVAEMRLTPLFCDHCAAPMRRIEARYGGEDD